MFHLSLWSYDKAPVQILVPLSGKSKEEVVRMGLEMNVPFDVTRSCYWDRAVHCGTCVSCRERREAFAAVGAVDPAEYEAERTRSDGAQISIRSVDIPWTATDTPLPRRGTADRAFDGTDA